MKKKLIILLLTPTIAFANYVTFVNKQTAQYDISDPETPTDPKGVHLIERTKLSNGGYEVWSDGYIVQWGTKAANEDDVVFPKEFTNANTVSFVIQEYGFGDLHSRQPIVAPTNTGVYNFYRSDLIGTWIAEGY